MQTITPLDHPLRMDQPIPPRPGPPPLPPNKPIFHAETGQYFSPEPAMHGYVFPNSVPSFPAFHGYQGTYPPNILTQQICPLSRGPAVPQPASPPPFPAPMPFGGPTAPHPVATSTLPGPGLVNVPLGDSPSYQWPDGSVKLECTVGNEPQGWDDEGWKWCSSGARRTGLPTAAFKVDKHVFLGVFHCACNDADGLPCCFFRPKTDKAARVKQNNEICPICRSQLYHNEQGNSNAVRQHVGRHAHACPPLKRLAAIEVEALDIQVIRNPQATAQQLRAAAALGQTPIGHINPILMDPRKTHSEVEKSKVRQQLVPSAARNSGFQFLESFTALKNSFETPWIVEADLLDRQFICMQTPFMRDVLLRDWFSRGMRRIWKLKVDVTQGILLTSLAFSQVLFRWVVVLYTWIGGQDQDNHLPHFKQLVQVIAETCTKGLGFNFDDRLFSTTPTSSFRWFCIVTTPGNPTRTERGAQLEWRHPSGSLGRIHSSVQD
ncbi:hypothetical protein B0H10DRAFT_1952936 [Mycena sp. CBHHK59/15]|nr:hypothetical protein B0H10DRAFT_1952936 [Mycena sp. CBHHK59/15]